jgi:large subunit ribosomal protein L31e
MAKKQEAKLIERVYNVPLRKEYMKVARWKRTKKAVKALREFLIKHMKSENVSISRELNDKVWHHGIKNPPHHVKVTVTKDSEGKVKAQLFGVIIKEKKKVEKKPKSKLAEKIQAAKKSVKA